MIYIFHYLFILLRTTLVPSLSILISTAFAEFVVIDFQPSGVFTLSREFDYFYEMENPVLGVNIKEH